MDKKIYLEKINALEMKYITQKSIPLLLFWTAWSIALYAKYTANPVLDAIAVPLFTITLLWDYNLQQGKEEVLYYAYTLCLLGDIMVMFQSIYYFVSGLTAYWGACILFLFTVLKEFKPSFKAVVLENKWIVWPIMIYLIYFSLVMKTLYVYFGDLFIPVSIYAFTLSCTCAISVCAYLKYRTRSTLYLCWAFILLSIAGTIIGFNKFYLTDPRLRFFETFFYGGTLFLLQRYYIFKNDTTTPSA